MSDRSELNLLFEDWAKDMPWIPSLERHPVDYEDEALAGLYIDETARIAWVSWMSCARILKLKSSIPQIMSRLDSSMDKFKRSLDDFSSLCETIRNRNDAETTCKVGGCTATGCEGGIYCFDAGGNKYEPDTPRLTKQVMQLFNRHQE